LKISLSPYVIEQNHLVVEMDEWAKLTGESIKFRGSVG